jgi:hypothetical protein
MLESIVDLSTNGQLHASFWHKNEQSIRTHGTQTLLKFQPYESYSPRSSKKGVIISTFLRVQRATSNQQRLFSALGSVIAELKTLNYPKSIIGDALNKLHATKHDKCWGEAVRLLHDEWY